MANKSWFQPERATCAHWMVIEPMIGRWTTWDATFVPGGERTKIYNAFLDCFAAIAEAKGRSAVGWQVCAAIKYHLGKKGGRLDCYEAFASAGFFDEEAA